ncbi:MAG: hypothetical protein AAF478_08200 [Pseudomonadota bacterium]
MIFAFDETSNTEDPVLEPSSFERKHYFDFHAVSILPFQQLNVGIKQFVWLVKRFYGFNCLWWRNCLGFVAYLTERAHVKTTIAFGKQNNLEMRLGSGFVGKPDRGKTAQCTGTIASYSVCVSTFYDLDEISENKTLFVGLGATVRLATQADVGRTISNFLTTDRDITTALYLMAGIRLKLHEKTDLYARYVGILSSYSEFSDRNAQGTFSTAIPGGNRNAFSLGMQYYNK